MTLFVENVERGFARLDDRSLLYLKGSEGRDLLQRISTNDLKGLESGPVTTILTNEKGRMVDVVTVMALDEKLLLLAGSSTDVSVPEAWIKRFVIMEDVVVERAGSDFHHFLFPGRLHSMVHTDDVNFVDAWGLHVLVPSGISGSTVRGLGENLQEIGSTDLEIYRVAKGIPRWGSELTEKYNPLEAGLSHLISWTKGCYVGQEVIARLDTYKKVQRHLITFSIARTWSALSRIYIGDREVGELTSIAQIDEKTYGMGYVQGSENGDYVVRAGDQTERLENVRRHGNDLHQGR